MHFLYLSPLSLFQNFRDNAKKYRSRCEKEQANKWQQIKIMRKTHESHLNEKRQLIRNLQDIIEEQEGRIFELESELKGTGHKRAAEAVVMGTHKKSTPINYKKSVQHKCILGYFFGAKFEL